MKTIKELSEELKTSKDAIYRQMKHPALKEIFKDHIVKIDHVSYIDEDGEQIIIRFLRHERQQAIQNILDLEKDINDNITGTETVSLQQSHIVEYIKILQEQVKDQNIQFETNNKHINQIVNQLASNQIMLKTEYYKKALKIQSEITVASIRSELRYRPVPFWRRILGN